MECWCGTSFVTLIREKVDGLLCTFSVLGEGMGIMGQGEVTFSARRKTFGKVGPVTAVMQRDCAVLLPICDYSFHACCAKCFRILLDVN